jgi:TspO/MBR family.
MKAIKWLYAIVFGVAFTLIIEWTGAIALSCGLEWYNTLTLPPYSLPPVYHSIIWCAAYVVSVYTVSKLVLLSAFKPFLLLFSINGILLALWTVTFFVLHLKLLSLIILLSIIIMGFYYEIKLAERKLWLAFVFLPVLTWKCYLFILNYCIVIIN